MSPFKFSLFNRDDDEEETVEIDDQLADDLRQVVADTPDLTLEQALREGLQHVVEKRKRGGGQQ
ncbi:hypothetical protein [Blastococcus tunisiensis]|uniref:Uncharacterized protein n=1 Tax=Blastococcus tunisiensis TaxID=1798228 RepID=A0A1I1XZP1_9ACTN|nr:hypothetical protein [Blastococcus sp. DSM 46838]SFE12774.1 hypothetical protein SAMN05216574_102221 [Blastococcus sp. DSM 46838]